ncbi:hypothetical protein L8X52_06490, partial [Campylobacter lari]|nr:hypothetical protein [Campylobacter lari]
MKIEAIVIKINPIHCNIIFNIKIGIEAIHIQIFAILLVILLLFLYKAKNIPNVTNTSQIRNISI